MVKLTAILSVGLFTAYSSAAAMETSKRDTDLGVGVCIGLGGGSGTSSNPTTVLLFKTFLSIGCWSDSPQARILHDFEGDVSPVTVQACINRCASKGLALAGMEFGRECFCGNAILGDQQLIDRSSCNTPCEGNNRTLCGGAGAMNLYLDLTKPFVTAGPPFLIKRFKQWKFLECTQDNGPLRQLPFRQDQIPHEDMSVPRCLDTCQKQGFTVGALQFAQECWCGNVTLPFPAVDNSNCGSQCTDDASSFCGGSGFNQVYFLPGATFSSS